MSEQSYLLTPHMVLAAVNFMQPGILELIRTSKERTGTQRVAAYIVVLDPAATEGNGIPFLRILWQGAVGETDPANWPKGRPYNNFALKKAGITFRTRKPGHLVQRDAPYLFQNNDFKYGGSDIQNGLIVATSGLEWYEDYAISSGLIGILRGFCFGAFEKEFARKALFIGGEEPKVV